MFTDSNPEVKELERKHQETTRVRNIERIVFGEYQIDTWYYSPYPEEYGLLKTLFVCEHCLKYMKHAKTLAAHECTVPRPPGELVYMDPGSKLSIFEVDGQKHKLYCQNLCLLAKLFLDHKTLYFDVSPFLFYVLTEETETGLHLMGYFSQERLMTHDYNLACIAILPPFQRRGLGKLLIAMSYALARRRGRVCTPEKPLSDMGKVGYKSYWTDTLFEALLAIKRERYAWDTCTVEELSAATDIQPADIIETLTSHGLLRYLKGEHVFNTSAVSVRVIEEHFARKSGEVTRFNPRWLLFDK